MTLPYAGKQYVVFTCVVGSSAHGARVDELDVPQPAFRGWQGADASCGPLTAVESTRSYIPASAMSSAASSIDLVERDASARSS